MSSHFWSSTGPGYIEPKRPYQLIGIIDFIQPFLIQSMDKPTVSINTTQVTKILKNGTVKKENHYKTDYSLNTINITAIDAHDLDPLSNLNNAQKLYTILTDGGYSATGNEIGPIRDLLRFPSFRILELLPEPKNKEKTAINTAIAAVGGAASALMGQGLAALGDGLLDATTTGLEFLNPHVAGVYTLLDPVFTSVDFGGGINYGTDGLITVSITVAYSNFKYDTSLV
jgi:hypothetical protein